MARAESDSSGDGNTIMRNNDTEPILIEDDEHIPAPTTPAKKRRTLPPEWFQPQPSRPPRLPPKRPVQTVFVGRLPAVQPSTSPPKKRKQPTKKEGAKRIRKSTAKLGSEHDFNYQRILERSNTIVRPQEKKAGLKAVKQPTSSAHEEDMLATGWHGIDQQACQTRYAMARAARAKSIKAQKEQAEDES